MSSKRRNRSRWDSSADKGGSRVTSSSPATTTAPDVPTASPKAAATEPAEPATKPAPAPAPTPAEAPAPVPAHGPGPASTRSPEQTATPPAPDFVLDYGYELSVPAQNIARRVERQQWLDPLPDYTNEYSQGSAGYGSQGRRHGSYPGEPPQSNYLLTPHNSTVLQRSQGSDENDKLQLLGQPGLASDPRSVDSELDRWRAIELARQNASLYGFSSGQGDAAHHMQLDRMAEINAEMALGRRAMDASMSFRQGSSHREGRDVFPQDLKARELLDRTSMGLQNPNLYCSVCAYAFSTPYQKEVHLQSHVKCEEEQCPFEATESKVKEHMLSEHGKHFQNLPRASGGSLKEVQGAWMSENQRRELEAADRNRNNGFSEPREGQRDGFPLPAGVNSQGARNEMELATRKSRDNWNSRMSNSSARYFPY